MCLLGIDKTRGSLSLYRKLCIPEGTNATLRLFEEPIPAPQRIKSPFVRNPTVPGPGVLSAPLLPEDDDQAPYYAPLDSWPPGTGQIYGYGKMVQQKKVAPAIEAAEEIPEVPGDLTPLAVANLIKPPAGEAEATGGEDANSLEQLAGQERFAEMSRDIGKSDLLPSFLVSDTFCSAAMLERPSHKTGLLWYAALPLQLSNESAKPAPSLAYLAALAQMQGY